MRFLEQGKRLLTDFFFPWGTYCVCCGNFIDKHRTYCLCDHCIRQIRWGNVQIPVDSLKENQFTGDGAKRIREEGVPIDSVRACMQYGLYSRRLIFELKYNGHSYMARILAELIFDRIQKDNAAEELFQAAAIIPVPVHRDRQRTRGFNQAEKIALYLGKQMRIPVLKNGLKRGTATLAQRSVTAMDRLSNLEQVFSLGDKEKIEAFVKGKDVILLDDIFTTGATAIQCGWVLKEAGANKVHVLCIASGNDGAEGFFT